MVGSGVVHGKGTVKLFEREFDKAQSQCVVRGGQLKRLTAVAVVQCTDRIATCKRNIDAARTVLAGVFYGVGQQLVDDNAEPDHLLKFERSVVGVQIEHDIV